MSTSRFNDNWDQFVKSLDSYGVEPKLKKDLESSVAVLHRSLGDDWLTFASETNHPLLWVLRTLSGSVSDLIIPYWANCIVSIEKIPDSEKLLRKIKDARYFESSITELEIASRLSEHGCSITIEPNIGQKQPDLLCKYENTEFLIEVKTFLTAKETERANRTSREIMSACNTIFPVGVIFKPLSIQHLDEVKTILHEKSEFALKNKTDVEVDIPKILKLYLISDEDPNRVQKYRDWYKKQESLGISKNYSGLVGPADGVRQEHQIRIRLDKVMREKQIPDEKLGIIILVSNFYFWKADDASELVDAILEYVYELSNIPAVILWSRKVTSDGKTSVTEREDFTFIENYLFGEIKENIIIVKNRFCTREFDYESLKKMLIVSEVKDYSGMK